ncbi:Poly(ADP-ribose) polymerase and DNA-Ligase Zn-finger region, partial [Ancylostoma duodenale]
MQVILCRGDEPRLDLEQNLVPGRTINYCALPRGGTGDGDSGELVLPVGMGQGPTESKNLPFGVEYARSSRATCKGCKNTIQQDTLRMSVREPSRHFDGLQDNWFHFPCFWKRIVPGKVEINEKSIKGIDTIRWDDQEKIREKIAGVENGDLPEAKSFSALKVEYAKTSRGKCSKCKLAIAQKEIKFAKHMSWFHQKCLFVDVKYDGEIKDIEGFGQLTDEDKLTLQDSLKEFQQLKQ